MTKQKDAAQAQAEESVHEARKAWRDNYKKRMADPEYRAAELARRRDAQSEARKNMTQEEAARHRKLIADLVRAHRQRKALEKKMGVVAKQKIPKKRRPKA